MAQVDIQFLDDGQFLFGLDAFGDDPFADIFLQCMNQRFCELSKPQGIDRKLNRRTVDFDVIRDEPRNERQGEETGAEVIDGIFEPISAPPFGQLQMGLQIV